MKYGLIGKTLVHSYSKEIHEALGKYTYELFSIAPEDVTDFVKAHDFGGLNVTIPYKQDVIPLCDEISPLAQSIGAVNTLYHKKAADGRTILAGHNTDYEGFLYTAKRSGIDFAGKTVLILGTGGTSLMARKAAADCGAARIYIASRSGSNGCSTAGDSRSSSHSNDRDNDCSLDVCDNRSHYDNAVSTSERKTEHACDITLLSYEALPEIASGIDIIVNTTPVGTFPNNLKSVVSVSDFPACEAIIDVIYNPAKTKLLMDAESAGLKTANGLPMLVAQATAAAGYFLGTPGVFEKENERIISELQSRMQNIVLIGMPGCGKSTIGRIIADKTGKTFIDMDDEIVEKSGKSIPQIFDEVGEAGFRDIESEVAAELGKQHGLVIATGGGAILRSKNVDALRQNAMLIHIRRPVDSLPTKGRPLSKDIDVLRDMESFRLPLYEAAADATFDNSVRLRKEGLKIAVYDFLQNI